MNGRPHPFSLALILATLFVAAPASAGIAEYTLTSGSQPLHITNGPDGALWFTERGSNKIGRITIAGAESEYAIPTPDSGPFAIVSGPDGALWFTEESADKIGRITTAGMISEFLLTSGAQPMGITAGADGNLWFVEGGANQIGKITPTGSISVFSPLSANSGLEDIAAGSDGNLWFTESKTGRVGRITTSGVLAEFIVLDDPPTEGEAHAIIGGPDGNLWITVATPASAGPFYSLQPVPTTGSRALETIQNLNNNALRIAPGPDGNLWITETGVDVIGRLTPEPLQPISHPSSTPTTEFLIPTSHSGTTDLTTGPDGNIWFTETSADKIGVLAPPGYSFLPTNFEFLLPPTIQYPPAGQSFSGEVATLNDKAGLGASNYTTTINWNDGSAQSSGTLTGNSPQFEVTGTHIYKQAGEYLPRVQLHDAADGIDSIAYGYAPVAAGALVMVPAASLTVQQGMPLTAVVASFTDANPFDTVASYTASVIFVDGCSLNFPTPPPVCQASPSTIAPGATSGTFTITSSHTFNGNGTFRVIASVSNVGNQPMAVETTANVTPAAFVLQLSSSAATVNPGQAANFTINVKPTSGALNGSVAFSCSGLPAGANCSFSPASVVPQAAGASTALTITTTANGMSYVPPRGGVTSAACLYAFGAAVLGLLAMMGVKRRNWLLPLALGVSSLALGCGGSDPSRAQTTPAGMFNINVTAKSMVASQTTSVEQVATIQLQVQ
jgi:virginiamycin B lyase